MLLIAGLVLIAAPSFAIYATYNNVADFLNDAGPLAMESFEGLAAGSTGPFTLSDFTLQGTDLRLENSPVSNAHATDGSKFVTVDGYVATPTSKAEFLMNSMINAFGLFITDWGDFGTGRIVFQNNASIVHTIAVSPQPSGNEMFFGIIDYSNSWNKVRVAQSISGELWGIDEVYSGNYIPEPATFFLLGGGLLGMAVRHRRRKR